MLTQLAGVAVVGGRNAVAEANLSKGGVTDLTVPGAIGVGCDGGGTDLVAQDPVQGGLAGGGVANSHHLTAHGVIFLGRLASGGWEDVQII